MALTDNLIAYWKFDESSGNAADATGNGYTLTNNNGVTYAPEKINNGAVFTAASSQSFSHAYASALNLIETDFSVLKWQKFTSLPSTGANVSLGGMFNGSSSNDRAWLFYFRNNAGSYELHLYTVNSSGSATDVSVSWTPSTGTLYNVGVSYNKTSGATKFYVDGAQQGTTQNSGTGGLHDVSANAPIFAIGDYYNGSAHNYLNGAEDEYTIFSRELSSSDFSSLYNSGAGLQYPFTIAPSFTPNAGPLLTFL